ncbi:hypothetical protein J7E81_01420 [Bacillus sp. ISL-18]|uniref:hypothetical protein n=1 Tax=Bacillus sp. ISL-18 TaxID=2819118 RepID=UPI001BEAD6F9|nr:hypothetical protein [Bacillus sp. ISL-18]MBT2653905.1 hypothetical protein [Bacillus sp. ISL-18]
MFIPIITKPVYVRFIRNADGSFNLRIVGTTGKPINICIKQFKRIFPGASTNFKVGLEKMDKAFAEEFFEEHK